MSRNFIDTSEAENMSIYKRYKFWIDSISFFEKILMVTEGFLMLFIAFMIATEIQINDGYEFIKPFAVSIIVILCCLGIFALVEMQRVSFCMSISAFGTDGKKDDAFFIILSLSISVLIWWVDKKGGEAFLNFTNSYDPKIESISTDVRIHSNESQRKKIESERAQKESSLRCSECLAIKANFDSKIVNERSKMRSGESGVAWKISENNKLRNSIKRLEAQRESEIAQAQARFEDMKNKSLESYDSRIMSLDTMQIRVKSSIDSANNEEKGKAILQSEENKKYGGYLTWFTQIALMLFRAIQAYVQYKDGKTFVQIGEFMKGASLLTIPINLMILAWDVFLERAKIWYKRILLRATDNVENYKNEIIGGDSRISIIMDSDAKSLDESLEINKKNKYETHTVEKKKSEKVTEIFENESEKAIILPKETPENDEEYYQSVISTFQMFFEDAKDSDPDKAYYKSVVNTFTLFLNDLK